MIRPRIKPEAPVRVPRPAAAPACGRPRASPRIKAPGTAPSSSVPGVPAYPEPRATPVAARGFKFNLTVSLASSPGYSQRRPVGGMTVTRTRDIMIRVINDKEP